MTVTLPRCPTSPRLRFPLSILYLECWQPLLWTTKGKNDGQLEDVAASSFQGPQLQV